MANDRDIEFIHVVFGTVRYRHADRTSTLELGGASSFDAAARHHRLAICT
jgi:uncharacterized cupin superfamily protein